MVLISPSFIRSALAAVISLAAGLSASAAILTTEDFSGGAAGFGDRDAGEMTVSYDGVNQWMQGSFAAQPLFPIVETDAFRLDSGTDFLGDYVTPGLTQIQFELFAANTTPSDMFIRLISGSDIFYHQFTTFSLASWETYTADLQYSFGWNGGSEAQFNAARANITAIEIELTRSGTGSQSYFLDNFQTLDTELGDVGAPTAVPEPNVVNLMLLTFSFLFAVRMKSVFRKDRPVTIAGGQSVVVNGQ